MAKKTADVMTADPRSIAPSATVVEAAKLMKDEDVGSLPVVHAGQLVGVITDRDLALRVVAEQRGPDTLVLEVASDRPVSVEPSANLDQALQLMAKHQVRRLPVVEDGRLVGVIAQADIARLGKDERTGALVEELSQP